MAEKTDAPVWIDCDAGADDALGDVRILSYRDFSVRWIESKLEQA